MTEPFWLLAARSGDLRYHGNPLLGECLLTEPFWLLAARSGDLRYQSKSRTLLAASRSVGRPSLSEQKPNPSCRLAARLGDLRYQSKSRTLLAASRSVGRPSLSVSSPSPALPHRPEAPVLGNTLTQHRLFTAVR